MPVAATLCLLPLSLPAQQNKLVVKPSDQVTAARGQHVSVAVKASILSGFHVNSDKPTDAFLIPFKLTWDNGPLTLKSVAYPKGQDMQLGPQKLNVFTGDVQVESEFEVPAQAQPGNTVLTGKIHYQACNNQMCFRPSSADVRVPVVVQ